MSLLPDSRGGEEEEEEEEVKKRREKKQKTNKNEQKQEVFRAVARTPNNIYIAPIPKCSNAHYMIHTLNILRVLCCICIQSRNTGASPFSFPISVLGSFTCITQRTGPTA